jgi:hypothetical protein
MREQREAGYKVWRERDVLVMDKVRGRLPDRCVVCNGPAGGYRLRKHFTWHPPEYYLAIPLGVLVYIGLALAIRKGAFVDLGLCENHRERRRKGFIIGWAGCGILFAVFNIAALSATWGVLVWCLVGMLPVVVVAWVRTRVASATKIDDRRVWLRVGQPFLESVSERSTRPGSTR